MRSLVSNLRKNTICLRYQKLLVGIVLLAQFLILLYPLLGPLTVGHDLYFHLYRIQGIHDGLIQGDFPVRINTAFMNGYGYPVGLCYGDIFLYLPAIFEIMGLSLTQSYKLFLIIFNLFVLGTSYYCFKRISGSSIIGVLCCSLWVLAPYRLVCIYLRASVGEFLAQGFLPILLYSSLQVFGLIDSRNRLISLVLISISIFSIICSHIISLILFLVTFSPIILIVIFSYGTKKNTALFLGSVLFGCLLALYFIVPFLDIYKNGNLVVTNITLTDKINTASWNATYLPQLFQLFPRLTGGSVAGVPVSTEMPQTLGFPTIFACLIVGYLIRSGGEETSGISKAVLISALLGCLLCTNCFPWWRYDLPIIGRIVSCLSSIQFPWRFLGGASFLLASYIGFLFKDSRQKRRLIDIGIVLVLVSLFTSVYSISSLKEDNASISFSKLEECPDKFGFMNGEYLPNDIELYDYDISRFTGLVDSDICKTYKATNKSISLSVDAHDGSSIVIPRLYYKYYSVDNASARKVTCLSDDRGLVKLTFFDTYKGPVDISFKYPKLWVIADSVSTVCFIGLFIVLLVYGLFKAVKRRSTDGHADCGRA